MIANYNDISQAMGQAIQAILLGKADPKEALDQAAAQVDRCWRRDRDRPPAALGSTSPAGCSCCRRPP